MNRLVVIPNDPITVYLDGGYEADWLKEYFNPCGFFDEVYILSPGENDNKNILGMTAIKTKPEELRRRVKQLNIDIVRTYNGGWTCDMAAANKVSGVPVVVSVHDTTPSLLHNSIKKADIVFCVSEAVKKLVLTKRTDYARVWIRPNGVDFNLMRGYSRDEAADLDMQYPFKYRILHVGRKTKQKNLDTLIKALKILGPEYCLIAVGKGDADFYAGLAKEAGVLERSYFIDVINNNKLARYFSWASCFCNPSRCEGMSFALIEALASQAVVVVSDIPEMSQYVTHMENGILVKEYENPSALAEMIKIACTDERIRERVKANSRESVEIFEKKRTDALEAGYYSRILEMKAKGDFEISLWKGFSCSIERNLKRFINPDFKRKIKSIQ